MKKDLHTTIITLFLLFSLISLSGETLSIGNEDEWKGTILNNLKTSAGRGGFQDLVIKTTELSPTENTDLLLPLNFSSSLDKTGFYTIRENPDYNQEYKKTGPASAAFYNRKKLVLQPQEGSLLAAHTNWEDFTIEFWLYPANPREGEQILQWKGLGRQGSQIFSQTIQCHFLDRKIVWAFDNFFQLPGDPFSHYEISGPPLLPREWHHHMLRYDSSTGMLEYLIDGLPVAITYTTSSGNESHTVYMPRIGEEPGNLVIGENLTGFMDEFRIEKSFIDNRSLNRYYKPGFGISPIIDLTYPDSLIRSLKPILSEPGNSEVFPYFITTNDLLEAEDFHNTFSGEDSVLQDGSPWKKFENLDHSAKGRYIILAFLLYPDLKLDQTPRLSSIQIEYDPSLPPLPPSYIRIERLESGSVELKWNSSPSPDVKGYLIFYGEKPGEYIYPGSPVDAGNVNSIEIDGLSPFKQFFFSIKAYNKGNIPQYSDFSEEISIRP